MPSYPWLFALPSAAGILTYFIDIGLLHPYNQQMEILKRVLNKLLHYRTISKKSTSWSVLKIVTLIIAVFVVICIRISPVRAALRISRSLHQISTFLCWKRRPQLTERILLRRGLFISSLTISAVNSSSLFNQRLFF